MTVTGCDCDWMFVTGKKTLSDLNNIKALCGPDNIETLYYPDINETLYSYCHNPKSTSTQL